jgi:para-nitrobenzyl esterase
MQLANKNDVVIVSMNHRLNVFGYLHLTDLGGDKYRQSGNVGMLDIVAALEWVRDNIATFGGDPSNVTIFGESGGGCKVNVLLAMPAASGLFQKAIVQSGSMNPVVSREEATRATHRLLGYLGLNVDQLYRLHELPAALLCSALRAIMDSDPPYLGAYHRLFWPVVDGDVIPAHPFDPTVLDRSADVPMIVGTTGDESRTLLGLNPKSFTVSGADLVEQLKILGIEGEHGDYVLKAYKATRSRATPSDLLFAIASDIQLRMDAIAQSERKAALHRAPVHMYLFQWKSPAFGGKYSSGHGFDVPFVFDVIGNAPGLWESAESAADSRDFHLAATISKAWAAFARTGTPAHSGLPHWTPYTLEDRATMLFDYNSRVASDPRREDRVAIQILRSSGPPTR